jgi:very-short-patch-repair endonuclease
MFNCPRCAEEFSSYSLLTKHAKSAYGLLGEALYREYHGITETPTCKCGCGTPTKWRINRGYGDYVSGHNAKGQTNPMYGKTHGIEAREQMSKTRREKFANGEYTFIDSARWSEIQKKVWQQDGYKEKMKEARERKGWRQKLSKAKTGEGNPWYKKKRPVHSKLMKSPEMVKKIFTKRSMTDIEQLVVRMLDQLNIPYHSQFFITDNGDTFAYDFKLQGLPIIIEVDGDYWHGGPQVKKYSPFLHETQEKDVIKNAVAQKHGYTVLRFWGSDLTEKPFWVVQEILKHI